MASPLGDTKDDQEDWPENTSSSARNCAERAEQENETDHDNKKRSHLVMRALTFLHLHWLIWFHKKYLYLLLMT
jgi:hypothetical protein